MPESHGPTDCHARQHEGELRGYEISDQRKRKQPECSQPYCDRNQNENEAYDRAHVQQDHAVLRVFRNHMTGTLNSTPQHPSVDQSNRATVQRSHSPGLSCKEKGDSNPYQHQPGL